MKIRYLKDNIWIVGLAAAILLFLNVFIQSNKSQGDYAVIQSYPSNRPSKKKKVPFPTDVIRKQETKAGFNPSWQEKLELVGTLIGTNPLAFITDLESGKSGVYKLDEIINGAKILSITPGRVVLNKNDFRYELLLKHSRADVHGNRKFIIAAVSPNEMIISRSGIFSQMDKAVELLAKVRILPIPDSSSDKLKGFRINDVPPGSIIEQAGVKNGDIICAVAGRKLKSTRDALSVFSDVQNRANIEVDLLRNGKLVTLRYKIRD